LENLSKEFSSCFDVSNHLPKFVGVILKQSVYIISIEIDMVNVQSILSYVCAVLETCIFYKFHKITTNVHEM